MVPICFNSYSSFGEYLIKKSFTAITRVWGTDGNGGVNASNISYTSEGYVKVAIDGATRVGGAIKSNELYDQGSFEFVASTTAKSGVATAFWTFFYADNGNVNHEIDIEAFNTNDVIYSSYTSESDSTHVNAKLDFDLSANTVHKYRFDWYRGEKVEYYIDDILVATITENIPTKPMEVWIGAWCPSWAGEQTNDKSEMTIYSFNYRSFN